MKKIKFCPRCFSTNILPSGSDGGSSDYCGSCDYGNRQKEAYSGGPSMFPEDTLQNVKKLKKAQ